MSNSIVGQIYAQIIEDVILSSRVDFDENGVDDSVLEDLKKGWMNRLSQFNVASFPWDPAPGSEPSAADASAAAAAAASTATATEQSASQPALADNGYTHATMSPMPGTQALPMPGLPMPSFDVKTEGGVKPEPDVGGLGMAGMAGVPQATPVPTPSYASVPSGADSAAARAQQRLHNAFGQRADASIRAIQSGLQGGASGSQQQAQYRAQVAAQTAAQMNSGLGKSQTDGAFDADEGTYEGAYEGVVVQKDAASGRMVELDRVEIDRLLHAQIAASAKQMEGGGLMLPLQPTKRAKKASAGRASTRRRKVPAISAAAAAHLGLDAAGVAAMTRAMGGQTDGGDDDDLDDLDDEDAINSDLDDPDDNGGDDEDDEDAMSPIMLCVYDKVQRVKNKWKCTLKDGVLTVNGREYLFHKATGEYEW